MGQLTYQQQGSPLQTEHRTDDAFIEWRWYVLPLIFAISLDFLLPQLIGWRLVPRPLRWLSDLAIGAMVVIVLMRMLVLDRIPKVLLLTLAIAILSATVALFEGQGITVTAYGLRRLFQYPLVGLYVFMMPQWPPWSAKWIMRICLIALGFNTLVQIAQYATGLAPGDFLAGMFGPHGTGSLIIFTLLVVSLGLGRWLASGDWLYLVVALGLGAVGSSLGSMKLFPIAVAGMAVIAVLALLIRGRRIRSLLVIVVVLGLGLGAFNFGHDTIFAGSKTRQIQDFLNVSVVNSYLGGVNGAAGVYKLSRNSEPVYVWNNNLQDPASFLFGKGVGSRARSDTLGFEGGWYNSTFFSGGPGRSLSVLMHETGVVGLMTFAIFSLAVMFSLFRRAGRSGDTDFASVQYALLLFTGMWPLWLWYTAIWIFAVPMLLYWTLIGFSFNSANNQAAQEISEAS